MKIPAFALFERSLRLETRSALMGWGRAGLLMLIMLVLVPIQTTARFGYIGAPGLNYLQSIAWVNLIFITLAGVSYFASAITEEKEEMMLGLLRMTDLNPVAILLGKSTSRFVGALLLLLTQVPFVLLAVTLGGVGALQIFAAYGTLLAYLFFVCNLALFFSVAFRTTNIAAAFTLSALLFFLFIHFWATELLREFMSYMSASPSHGIWALLTAVIQLWHDATPPVRLSEVFRTGFTGPAIGFQIVSNVVLGILFFLLAWLAFDRCTRDEKEPAPFRGLLPRRTSRTSRIPPGLVGSRALSWKDFTFTCGGKFGLGVRFAVMAFLIGLIHFIAWETGSADEWFTRKFEGGVFIWVSLMVTAVCMAADASRIFSEETRWKTLSSLVMLPITVPELAYRKVAGALVGTLPLLSVFVIGVCLVPDGVKEFFNDLTRSVNEFGFFIVAILQFVMFLHLTAFLSLVVKRGALALAVAIQYIGGTFVTTFVGIIFAFSGGRSGSEILLCLTAAVCIVMTVVLHRAIGHRLAKAAAEE